MFSLRPVQTTLLSAPNAAGSLLGGPPPISRHCSRARQSLSLGNLQTLIMPASSLKAEKTHSKVWKVLVFRKIVWNPIF